MAEAQRLLSEARCTTWAASTRWSRGRNGPPVPRETFAELCQVLESVPDERLADVQSHPMDPARNVTTADLLFLAYWNLVYHTGQINYLQTMLGDTEQRV